MKVLALTNKITSPSARIRIAQMADYLNSLDIGVEIIEVPTSNRKLAKILKTKEYDLVWLQKKMTNIARFITLKIFSKSPIVFDFDDNLIVKMRPKKGTYRSKGREIKFALTKNISGGFTCGNKFLGTLIEDTKKPYLIYPTPVPINVAQKECKNINNPIIIGWLGLSAGFMYLDRIINQLKELYREINFKLVIVSEEDYNCDCDFIENIRWRLDKQEEYISQFDIGIMPLNTESPYDKGKSSYKLLQYMASGVIPVGEAYGTNMNIIENGKNGFLVFENKWYETLKAVIKGIQEGSIAYCKISEQARKTAVENYSYEALAPKLAEFFKKIAQGGEQ